MYGSLRRTSTVAAATSLAALLTARAAPRAEMHCQVPCGIFDDQARVGAMAEDVKTIRKAMMQLASPPGSSLRAYPSEQDLNQMTRWVITKEEHAEKIIRAVSDYFLTQKMAKMTQHKEYLQLLALHHAVMIAAMKTKQSADMKTVETLSHCVADLAKVYISTGTEKAAALRSQDDKTSNLIISELGENPTFLDMARRDGESIRTRDAEDAQKLAVGIQKAVDRGVLPAMPTPPAYQVVDVLGKSADQVAAEICAQLPQDGSGFVVTLVGLSGTGKGTTVSKLKASLPGASTWSNGNIFRSLTLLAVTHCEQQGVALTPEVLTAENLQTWMGMLSFGEFNGRYDIRIRGLGLDLLVSEVQNTTLKQRKVGKNIPTVAQETQGEVVKFAADALKQLSDAGKIVLLEGREQTVNYIPTEYRFELIMSDPELIGKRRAAQRIAGEAVKMIGEGTVPNQVVTAAIEAALHKLA